MTLASDISHALRRLLRAPGFTVVALLTLALGIGANTAIFSIVRTVLLQPLPYGNPERLVMLWGALDKGETTWIAAPEVLSYASDIPAFESVAAYGATAANLTGGQEPERVIAAIVTPNLFHTLGVQAQLGRTFQPADSAASISDQVVIGYGLWQRRFGGDPSVIGTAIQVNGAARTLIGVMPASFRLPLDFSGERPSELWTPLDVYAQAGIWGSHSFLGVARLRADADANRASAQMRTLAERWVRDGYHAANNTHAERGAVPMHQLVLGDVRYALWILLGAVGVILLIACANVANLTLARSDDRHREIALRTAIGASRRRIIQQLLTESVLLALIGGVLGVILAWGGLQLLLALRPAGIPRVDLVGLDVGVLVFTLLLTLLTGIAFGIAPALELSRPDLTRSLKEGGRSVSVGRTRQRFRDSLAVAQMAMSVVLLIGALLLTRSFIELRRVDLGFRPDSALSLRVALPAATYADSQSVIDFQRTLKQRIAQLPGVRSVGATRLLPLTGTIGDWSITIEGKIRGPNDNPNGDWQVVTDGYFESMGMRMVRGRSFTEADNENSPIVAVINETMANRYWPGEDPLGKRFHLGTADRPWITIVGVAGQVRHNAVVETARAEMYVPIAQWVAAGGSVGTTRALTWVIRTSGDPLGVLGYVRETVRAMDPSLPIADVKTLARVADDSLAQPRFTTMLLGLFAALALTLAAVGIYGVISLLVTRRRQEIGIRMALGARRGVILGMVVRRGMALAGIGVITGIVVAALLTRVVSSLLYGVTAFDAVSFGLVPVILAVVALLASVVPAARAARLDPVVALREE